MTLLIAQWLGVFVTGFVIGSQISSIRNFVRSA